MIRIRRIAAHNFKQLREVDLYLPQAGRFLIQGKNEAGKSTLFEAVFFGLFGQPLVTETPGRRLDDLIAYDVEKGRVEVWVEAPGRLLKIHRTIVRRKPNAWELWIETPGGVEEVRGNRAVNQRILGELGFDGEALLNTCFVEQKKLEKLEGMSKAQREGSLMKLLNLEQMTRLEADLKLRAEDRLALERCRQRAELARIQAELPEKEEALGQVEGKLLLIELRKTTEAAVQEQRAIGHLERDIAALSAQRETLASQVARIDRLKEGLQALQDIQGYREQVTEQTREIQRLEADLEEAERLRKEALPALEKRLRSLDLLRSRLERLQELTICQQEQTIRADSLAADLAELRARQEQLKEESDRLKEIVATIEAEEGQLETLNAVLRDFEVEEALEAWLAAQQEVLIPSQLEVTIDQKQAEREHLSQRLRLGIFGFLAAFLVSAAMLFGFVMAFLRWGISPQALPAMAATFLLLIAVLLALLGWRLWGLWQALDRVAEQLGELQGERRTLETTAERERERLVAAEEQLQQLGVTPPEGVEAGQARLVELTRRIGEHSQAEVKAERDGARERLAQARALHGEVERGIERLQEELAAQDERALREEEQASRDTAEKAGSILARWRAKMAELAASLGVEADLSAVQSLLGGEVVEAQGMRRRIESIPTTGTEIARRREKIEGLLGRAAQRYQVVQDLLPGTLPWSIELTDKDYQTLKGRLLEAYEKLGGEQARRHLERVQGELGSKEGERRARLQRAQQLLQHVRESLVKLELDRALSEAPSLDELEELLARLQSLDLGQESALVRERDELRERVGHLRQQQADLESRLGLEGEVLDLEACQAELAALERGHAVRERALLIVETARHRLVEKILPTTMEHMRQLLPTLTMQRYYDAELTDEYRIRVWDERAGDKGGWKEKNIFSGGTKDQFSLALRLAFALATLPAERGAAPSFIFLDEPLGSFDDERAQALLDLLTEGEIARSFDQIFLISHVRVNPRLFTHHITLDAGRVVEHDLPSPDTPSQE